MFENEIARYEELRQEYERLIASRIDGHDRHELSALLLSTHSCAIEGNTFTLDDTRELREHGLVDPLGTKKVHHGAPPALTRSAS